MPGKNTMVLMLFGSIAIAGLQSCYKVATVPRSTTATEITAPVSFAADILPVFEANCSMSGCHSSGGTAPDLTAEKAYTSLGNGGYMDPANPENSNLYLWITGAKGTPMPPGAANPSNINSLVLAWIQQGAQNN
jgi:hypothetical protein